MSRSFVSTSKFIGVFPPSLSNSRRHTVNAGSNQKSNGLQRKEQHLNQAQASAPRDVEMALSTDGEKVLNDPRASDSCVGEDESIAGSQDGAMNVNTLRGGMTSITQDATIPPTTMEVYTAESFVSDIDAILSSTYSTPSTSQLTSPADSFSTNYSRASSAATSIDTFPLAEFALPEASCSTHHVTSLPLPPIMMSRKGKEKEIEQDPTRLILRVGLDGRASLVEEPRQLGLLNEEDENDVGTKDDEQLKPDYSKHQTACHFHRTKCNKPIMSCVNFPECPTIWCEKCLVNNFPHVEFTVDQTFECPVCTDICSCARCRRKRGEVDQQSQLPPLDTSFPTFDKENSLEPSCSSRNPSPSRKRKSKVLDGNLADEDSIASKRPRRKQVDWRRDQEDFEFAAISVGKTQAMEESERKEDEENRVYVPTGDVVVGKQMESEGEVDDVEEDDDDVPPPPPPSSLHGELDDLWDFPGFGNAREEELSSLDRTWERFEALRDGGGKKGSTGRQPTIWHQSSGVGNGKRLSIVGGSAPETIGGLRRRSSTWSMSGGLQVDTTIKLPTPAPFATSPSLTTPPLSANAASSYTNVVGPFTTHSHAPMPRTAPCSPVATPSSQLLSPLDLDRQGRDVRLAIQRAHERAGGLVPSLDGFFEAPQVAVPSSAFFDSQQLPHTRTPSIASSSDSRSNAVSGSMRRSSSVSSAPSSYNPFDNRSVLSPSVLADMSDEKLGEVFKNVPSASLGAIIKKSLLAGYDWHKTVAGACNQIVAVDWDAVKDSVDGSGMLLNSPITISTEFNRKEPLNLHDVIDETYLRDPPTQDMDWSAGVRDFGWQGASL